MAESYVFLQCAETLVSDPETMESKREESRQVGERADAMELSK